MPPWHGAEHVDETFKFESPGLTNCEYAPLAEVMGRVAWAPEVFNCSAPDTGNMEVLQRYGTREQKDRWLKPLMNGEIRSAYCMTEPAVASSDATNIETEIRRDGDAYVINGRKWWSSGAFHPRCELLIVMGKTDPGAHRFRQQSMILVPRATPGVKLVRSTSVYGYPHRGHGGHAEIVFDDVRVPATNILKGEGCGFEIAQGRLGPGRIHHAMRTIGQAEVALEAMCKRLLKRVAFGKPIAQHSFWEERIAQARTEIEMARLLRAQGGVHDGHRRQQGGPGRDRDDQGRGAAHGRADHRRRGPGARRRGRERRLRPRRVVGQHPTASASRTGPTRFTIARSRASS